MVKLHQRLLKAQMNKKRLSIGISEDISDLFSLMEKN